MANTSLQPTYDPLFEDPNNPVPAKTWILFFDRLFRGDPGKLFTPVFTNLTEVGGDAQKTGRYFRISNNLVYFSVTVTPVTSVSGTAGTTFFGFPLDILADGMVGTTLGLLSDAGSAVASQNRIYPASFTGATSPVTISGVIWAQ